MSLSLGQRLRIRAMTYVAGEPIPFFWPMRAFIHHNPLHGLEHLPFEEAVAQGARLFHCRCQLPRRQYQAYLAADRIDRERLQAAVTAFAAGREPVPGIDLQAWCMALLTRIEQPVTAAGPLADPTGTAAALAGTRPAPEADIDPAMLADRLCSTLLGETPVYEAVDALFGTGIGAELDELVIKSCLDFFDEGQSVWGMPLRSRGFFTAWREVASRNVRLFLRGMHIKRILAVDETPEGVIDYVMRTLGVAEQHWSAYFTRELARLHGWAGFIRWRSSARHYHWGQRYPGDLVDLLAVRLTLALALLQERGRRFGVTSAPAIRELIETRTPEAWLRHELHTGRILPDRAQQVEESLALGGARRIEAVFGEYVRCQRTREAERQAQSLRSLAEQTDDTQALERLDTGQLDALVQHLREFERREGMLWLRAMEAHAMHRLLSGIQLAPPPPRDKRPFVQALFCIDTRSERIRRQLESIGDYQTFGIAGFFGVPVSFMELGKGSETHLCPVLLTPKNLALEMSVEGPRDLNAVTAMEKALHELKESVLSPFVTVEAIGLLFGFDMIGKTLLPRHYNRWRSQLHEHKPPTHLLLDKLDRDQADSIVRAVQRAVIVKALEQEFQLTAERIPDTLVRELREAALGRQPDAPELANALGLDSAAAQAFIRRLREVYRIDPAFARLQLERLARIGFSLDEQVGFVSQALRSIGLTRDFSRFILLAGHGSTSENNPYESALDCGACGGNHGLVNARVLAQMANKPEVRQRLRAHGIEIPDDAWFIPALHNTTTDTLALYDLDRLPSSHVVYLDRLRKGLTAASRLCARERLPALQGATRRRAVPEPAAAQRAVQRNAMDWSQVRPEWGLSGNAYFVIGRRDLTRELALEGRAFLHSYDYRLDPKRRLLENILTGPLVVGQWINMEHYFSTVDNECFGSGSKVYHNVAGRFGVMTGNLSDLRTGLPAQTVLEQGRPYHQPVRLITLIEAPFEHARRAVDDVTAVKHLVRNGWIRLLVIDPETAAVTLYDDGEWREQTRLTHPPIPEEST
ncbi:UPF0753 protein [Thiohalobacter sp. COW1]|uniref:Probable inorganic carbon transporter subunit DabA n=1 Tax=Thiohalobacter thiocyanaticus TaxID=585455 RepID=A0A1Z4VPS3_9GAMM|nr:MULTISPECIES: DUF2309 domain-containing protein [Thiohalobacter]BAZ93483.1 uncharacterized protein FOKN1_1083 [Thiohalobacter thiocyanaticus]BCO31475.1 UPF0753 protein [Thiohalobacter sp. COW1]